MSTTDGGGADLDRVQPQSDKTYIMLQPTNIDSRLWMDFASPAKAVSGARKRQPCTDLITSGQQAELTLKTPKLNGAENTALCLRSFDRAL